MNLSGSRFWELINPVEARGWLVFPDAKRPVGTHHSGWDRKATTAVGIGCCAVAAPVTMGVMGAEWTANSTRSQKSRAPASRSRDG